MWSKRGRDVLPLPEVDVEGAETAAVADRGAGVEELAVVAPAASRRSRRSRLRLALRPSPTTVVSSLEAMLADAAAGVAWITAGVVDLLTEPLPIPNLKIASG